MRKIKIYIYFLIINLLLLIFFFNYFIIKECKQTKIIKYLNSYGYNNIVNCLDFGNPLDKVKLHINYKLYGFVKNLLGLNKHPVSPYTYNNKHHKDNFDEIEYKSKSKIQKIDLEKFPTIENYSNEKIPENWFRSNGNNNSNKFFNNDDINKKNLKKLKLIWSFQSKTFGENIQINPIFIDEKIIFVGGDLNLYALNGKNGQIIWKFDNIFKPAKRGIVAEYDEYTGVPYLYFPVNNKIYKINISSGKIEKKFGNNGFIKTSTIVANAIYRDYLINLESYKKTLQIYDKKNGKLINEISYKKDTDELGGLAWGGFSIDENGLAFITTGNPRPANYGANRPGKNSGSNSIIAINVLKNKILWEFQETFHDLWDFDIASPPIIHDLYINKKLIPTIVVPTKIGNTIILERTEGKPIFDIALEEYNLPSSISSEITSKYQLSFDKPESFLDIEYNYQKFNKLNNDKKKYIENFIKKNKYGKFEPPSFAYDLVTFGSGGGASWTGGVIDPEKQYLYVLVNNVPHIIRPTLQSYEYNAEYHVDKKNHNFLKLYYNKCSSCHGNTRNGGDFTKLQPYARSLVGITLDKDLNKKFNLENIKSKHSNLNISLEEYNNLNILFNNWDENILKNNQIYERDYWFRFTTNDNLPASNPPYGYIAKLDLVNGKLIWKSTVGYKKIGTQNKKYGSEIFGGVALNKDGLIFVTGTDDSKSYILDDETGEELWSFQMKAAGSTAPLLYKLNGKTYVSFLSTGGIYDNYKEKDSVIYTFSIE
jgi:quinoprotein glucose dehydrogenase